MAFYWAFIACYMTGYFGDNHRESLGNLRKLIDLSEYEVDVSDEKLLLLIEDLLGEKHDKNATIADIEEILTEDWAPQFLLDIAITMLRLFTSFHMSFSVDMGVVCVVKTVMQLLIVMDHNVEIVSGQSIYTALWDCIDAMAKSSAASDSPINFRLMYQYMDPRTYMAQSPSYRSPVKKQRLNGIDLSAYSKMMMDSLMCFLSLTIMNRIDGTYDKTFQDLMEFMTHNDLKPTSDSDIRSFYKDMLRIFDLQSDGPAVYGDFNITKQNARKILDITRIIYHLLRKHSEDFIESSTEGYGALKIIFRHDEHGEFGHELGLSSDFCLANIFFVGIARKQLFVELEDLDSLSPSDFINNILRKAEWSNFDVKGAIEDVKKIGLDAILDPSSEFSFNIVLYFIL